MSYALSFAPEFFWGEPPENERTSARPTSVHQALKSLSDEEWASLARHHFGTEPADLDIETVIQTVMKTNTCENLDPPVRVYIDPGGWFSILVHEEEP